MQEGSEQFELDMRVNGSDVEEVVWKTMYVAVALARRMHMFLT